MNRGGAFREIRTPASRRGRAHGNQEAGDVGGSATRRDVRDRADRIPVPDMARRPESLVRGEGRKAKDQELGDLIACACCVIIGSALIVLLLAVG